MNSEYNCDSAGGTQGNTLERSDSAGGTQGNTLERSDSAGGTQGNTLERSDSAGGTQGNTLERSDSAGGTQGNTLERSDSAGVTQGNTLERSLSESNNNVVNHEIFFYQKWNIHYRAHKSPKHFAILCQMYPVNAVMSHFSKFHLRLGLPGSTFPSRLPIELVCISDRYHALRVSCCTCPW